MIPIARDTGSIDRVRRARPREGPGSEVPELARDADLFEEPHAVWPEPDQRRPPQGQRRHHRRGLLRFRAGLSGRRPAGSRHLRHGADAGPGEHLLRRFASKTVLCFDPDAAGQGAAERSCELLVSEGFDVNVAVLPGGQDPDTFLQTQGRPRLCRRASAVEAVSGLPARPGGRRAGSDPGRGSTGFPAEDAGRGRADSRPGGTRPVRGSAGPQGPGHGGGRAAGDPAGRRPEEDRAVGRAGAIAVSPAPRRRAWAAVGASCTRPETQSLRFESLNRLI